MDRSKTILLALATCSFLLTGCDQSEPAKKSSSSSPTGGDGSMGKVPEDIATPLADDYQATSLLNDAYAALEKGDHANVLVKLAEVEKLTRVSPGIGTQIAEIRSKLAAKVSAASQPTTSPK